MTSTETGDLAFNVSGLLKEGVGATRRHDLEQASLGIDEDTEAREVSGHVRLLRINTGVLAEGGVAGDIILQCSRCLISVASRQETTFQEEFRPMVDVNTGMPVTTVREGESEDDFFLLSPNHMLDLTEKIRQAMLVALPYSPLCSADCAGLCPNCGADLNIEQCGCILTIPDSRLKGLAAILEQIDDTRRNS